MNVLVVEDDRRITKLLNRELTEDGHQVFVSGEGREALDLCETRRFDVVVLDVLLPGLDGFQILKQLRDRECQTPILMLTARDAMTNMVHGLDLGADDYLTKPFLLENLLARVRALGRRAVNLQPVCFQACDLMLDRATKQATRAGRRISLTSKEYKLLELLLRRANQVVSRDDLVEAGWGFQTDVRENTLDFYIHSLRDKIELAGERSLIRTVRGLGYQLSASPEEIL
jgi:two-component system copper resistance phosphate regulon response regulator CusR